jgi:hypothetical protein
MRALAILASGLALGGVRAAAAAEGVVEINEARSLAGGVTTGDAPGYPVTLSEAGSYLLTGNLNVSGGADAIEITADSVALDLNGFVIAAAGNAGTAIVLDGRTGVEIRGGTLRGFSQGITENSNGRGHRVVDIRVLDMYSDGLFLQGSGHVVEGCSVIGNGTGPFTGGFGIVAGSNARVWGNIASLNGGDGIAGGGSVRGNTAYGNGFVDEEYFFAYGTGIAGGHSAVCENTAYLNVASGIEAGEATVCANAAYKNGTSQFATGIGIAHYNASVTGNAAAGNQDDGIRGIGEGLVKGNAAYSNGRDGIAWVGAALENAAHGNARYGLWLDADAGYARNVLTSNGTGAVNAGIEIGTNLCVTDTSCP